VEFGRARRVKNRKNPILSAEKGGMAIGLQDKTPIKAWLGNFMKTMLGTRR